MLKNLTRGVLNKGWNFWEFLITDFLRLNYTGNNILEFIGITKFIV